MKRLTLFLFTNFVVVSSFSVFLQKSGLSSYFGKAAGVNFFYLFLFCFLWGISGSLSSLLFSRIIAKKLYDIEVIDPNTEIAELKGLLQEVKRLSELAGLSVTPEVGIYDSEEINAFATGPTQNRSIVALSTGLLSCMSTDQIRAVLAHEIGHIANGDMVTISLLQGTINSFVFFLASSKVTALNEGFFCCPFNSK